nr:outer membrane beta-barrel protein [Parachlamydiaceae bacterium]
MKNFLFILAAIFALSTTQMSAEEDFYAGVFGGANWLNISGKSHHHSSGSDNGSRVRDRLKYRTGYIIGGSIGYRWCGGLRVEGEIAYRNNQRKRNRRHNSCNDEVVLLNDCSSYSSYSCCSSYSRGNNNDNHQSRKHAQTVSYMANVLYDLPFECTPWKAFVGVGIGYAQQKGSNRRNDRRDNSSSYSCCDSDYSYTCDSDYSYTCSDYSRNCSDYSRSCKKH